MKTFDFEIVLLHLWDVNNIDDMRTVGQQL